MVQIKLIVGLLTVFIIQITAPYFACADDQNMSLDSSTSELRIYWKNAEKSSRQCKHLVEIFLNELRATTNDRKIELDITENSRMATNSLNIDCGKPDALAQILVTRTHKPADPLVLHYLEKALGFDAADWLRLQQEYLRESTEISVAPTPLKLTGENESSALSAIEKSESKLNSGSKAAIFQQWWFWAIVAGVGASAFAISQAAKGGGDSSINVEIR